MKSCGLRLIAMYKCQFCGNEEHFIEHNYVETEVLQNDDYMNIVNEEFLCCVEVLCGKCNKQIMEDGEVVVD
jgi:predicted restriction endonuclease